MFAGDGYIYYDIGRHYRVEFYLNPKKDEDIAYFILVLLRKIKLFPCIMFHHGCLIIRLNSKIFHHFLKEKYDTISREQNETFMLGFISGFIDSDGYVAKGDIVISNSEKNLLEIVQLFCQKTEIYSKLWSQKVVCKGKESIIWRLRVGTRFKYKQQYSRKIRRIYGRGIPTDKRLPNHSEYPS